MGGIDLTNATRGFEPPPIADACSMLINSAHPLPWLLPFRHWSPSTTLHLTTTRHVARQAQFHGKPGTVPCPSSSLVGQPLGRGQGRYPRACSHVLCSLLRLLRPLTCGDVTACYITVAVRLWFGQDEPGQLHLSTRKRGRPLLEAIIFKPGNFNSFKLGLRE